MRFLLRAFLSWLPLCVGITLICVLMYAAVQQNYRQSLNDPQIQMAEDAAHALEAGTPVAQVIPVGYVETVDISASLSPWLTLYSASGTPLLSTGVLDGAMPQLPLGVFNTAQWNALVIGHHLNSQPSDEDRFTWQPEDGVRQAVVLVSVVNADGVGFVAAGRNMREVENRESGLSLTIALGWVLTLLMTYITTLVSMYVHRALQHASVR